MFSALLIKIYLQKNKQAVLWWWDNMWMLLKQLILYNVHTFLLNRPLWARSSCGYLEFWPSSEFSSHSLQRTLFFPGSRSSPSRLFLSHVTILPNCGKEPITTKAPRTELSRARQWPHLKRHSLGMWHFILHLKVRDPATSLNLSYVYYQLRPDLDIILYIFPCPLWLLVVCHHCWPKLCCDFGLDLLKTNLCSAKAGQTDTSF